jgi:hypothetical protein
MVIVMIGVGVAAGVYGLMALLGIKVFNSGAENIEQRHPGKLAEEGKLSPDRRKDDDVGGED